MHTPTPASSVIDLEFAELDEFLETLGHWKLDFRQIDRGHTSIRMVLADYGGIQLGYAALNRRYAQRSISPLGMRTFVLLDGWTTDAVWDKEKLDDQSLLCYPRDNPIIGVSGPDFRVFTVTVPDSLLIERAEALDHPEAIGLLSDRGNHFRIPATVLQRLRTCLQIQSARLLKYPAAPLRTHSRQCEILDLLIMALATHSPVEHLVRPQIRYVALKRAIDYPKAMSAINRSWSAICPKRRG